MRERNWGDGVQTDGRTKHTEEKGESQRRGERERGVQCKQACFLSSGLNYVCMYSLQQPLDDDGDDYDEDDNFNQSINHVCLKNSFF